MAVIQSDTIIGFINRFTDNNQNTAVIEKFQCGCCYWFAEILYERFFDEGTGIVYDVVANHFATKIHGRVYDITGDVTDQYNFVDWNYYDDTRHKDRIYRDCVFF